MLKLIYLLNGPARAARLTAAPQGPLPALARLPGLSAEKRGSAVPSFSSSFRPSHRPAGSPAARAFCERPLHFGLSQMRPLGLTLEICYYFNHYENKTNSVFERLKKGISKTVLVLHWVKLIELT